MTSPRPGRVPLAAALVAMCLAFVSPPGETRSRGTLESGPGRLPATLYAGYPPYVFTHNAGLLTLQVTNLGMLGNIFIDDFSAGWRGGEYLFLSGLWIGAVGGDSEPHVSGTEYASNRVEFEFRPDLDPRWTVYASHEGQRGGLRMGVLGAAAADDDGDGLVDEDFQNGLDDDGDGQVDEDFQAIGQQMFSCQYRDDTPEALAALPDHVPLGLLVRQRSFQWSSPGINEFVGLDFEVVNTGSQRLKEVYLAFFSDTDAGPKTVDNYWTDDLVGWSHIDTVVVDPERPGQCQRIPLAIDAAYMWDAPDNGTTVTGGDVPGVFGTLFLGHTVDDAGIRAPQRVGLNTVAWFSSSGENPDPQDDYERYQLISSGTKPVRNETRPNDYRYVVSAGPFAQLNPGESLRFQTAYVIGERQTGFRVNAVNAQRVYNGIYLDADGNPATGVGGKERCLQSLEPGTRILWDDPCDTLNVVISIKDPPPCDVAGGQYVDADCDPCTGLEGRETLVTWVGTTAPPSPGLNTDPSKLADPGFRAESDPAGDHAVVLAWDNASELARDPITGERLFNGYKIWRADNWQRPVGSIGPAPGDWMKIVEFWEDPSLAQDVGAQDLLQPFPTGAVDRTVKSIGTTREGLPVYPVGRYRYVDSRGIVNGKLYFYAVTAFAIRESVDPVSGRPVRTELGGLPSAVEAEAVVPRWDSREGCAGVSVVPNPYRGRADWDLIPSERDPTGSRIAFRNLPAAPSTIRIYTLAGDLVQEAVHDGSGGDGTYFWNLITRNGQNVTSGIYLYSVRAGGETCRGRFVIIR